jgi:iron complex transport system substrate-binding protein
MRVVSLLASATETVFALGKGDVLVGRSHECDYPAEAAALRRCSKPSFDIEGTSAQIDRAVRAAAEKRAKSALSIYDVDEEALRELRPDVILTQTQCEVCAVSPKDLQGAYPNAEIVALHPGKLADVYADIKRIGAAVGARFEAEDLVTSMRARLAAIHSRVRGLPIESVAVLEWLDPLMSAGHWIPELVELAGGRDVFGKAGEKGRWLTFDDLLGEDPELIVGAPCGYHLGKARPELRALAETEPWRKLRAVQEWNVFAADGNSYFSRPGPRLVETAEMLAAMLHPDEAPSGCDGFRRLRA